MLQTHAVRTGSTVGQAGQGCEPTWVHLRSAGVSLLLEVRPAGLPVVRHWGADLGSLDRLESAALAAGADPDAYAVLPPAGLAGTHEGRSTEADFRRLTVRLVGESSAVAPDLGLVERGADTVLVEAEDPGSGLGLDLALQLTTAGVVRCRAGLVNRAGERYRLDGLTLLLPAGPDAAYALELDELPLRSSRLRPGSTSVSGRPAQVVVGVPGAGFRRGEVWHAHVAFSGAVTPAVEVTAAGRAYLGGGERLVPGEVVLGPEESYHSPWVCWSWGDGLDAAAARTHAELRSPDAPTVPVIFDAGAPAFARHDRTAMLGLAEYAAAVGVETFLLDTGWCVRAGLDPYADSEVRGQRGAPDDLAGLLGRIRDFGLEVGLAVALERLDPGLPIAEDHPDWLLEVEREGGIDRVLDLSVRGAMVHVWERLTKLLDRHPVSLLSWSPVPGARRRGSAGRRHAGALAAYRLVDALRERYPDMLIMSPARDAAMARRAVVADWAVEGVADSARRHAGFAALAQLLPPERCWLPAYDEPEDGSTPGHRALAGFFGALGLGLDLRRQAPASLRVIHRWLGLYAGFRPLLHTGRTVRLDTGDARFVAHGVVGQPGDEALFALVWLDRSEARRVRLDGLDPATAYRLEIAGPRPADTKAVTPDWSTGEPPVLTGQMLETVGITLPAARRGSALLLHLTTAR